MSSSGLSYCVHLKKRTKISHDLFLHSYPFSLIVNFIIFSFSHSAAHTPVERTVADFWTYQEIIKNQSLPYNITHTVHHVLQCTFIYQLPCTIRCFFTHILFLAQKHSMLRICEKNTVFNRQLMITHKYLVFYGRIVVRLKLPEMVVNNTETRRIKNWYPSEETQWSAQRLVEKRILQTLHLLFAATFVYTSYFVILWYLVSPMYWSVFIIENIRLGFCLWICLGRVYIRWNSWPIRVKCNACKMLLLTEWWTVRNCWYLRVSCVMLIDKEIVSMLDNKESESDTRS